MDLDHVIDQQTGEIEPWVIEIIEKLRNQVPGIDGGGLFQLSKPIGSGRCTVFIAGLLDTRPGAD